MAFEEHKALLDEVFAKVLKNPPTVVIKDYPNRDGDDAPAICIADELFLFPFVGTRKSIAGDRPCSMWAVEVYVPEYDSDTGLECGDTCVVDQVFNFGAASARAISFMINRELEDHFEHSPAHQAVYEIEEKRHQEVSDFLRKNVCYADTSLTTNQ
mgnify:CR=1 FL=1